MSLFLRRVLSHHLPQFPCSIHHRLLFSTTATQDPTTNPQFAIDYLMQSCGLTFDKALKASKKIQHLKSPKRPDAVLAFLRQNGIPEPVIRTAVLRNSGILCSSVEKIWRPNVEKLREVGLSMDDISNIISHSAGCTFQTNFVSKIDFWLLVLGSVENLSGVLRKESTLLKSSLEKVIVPNLSLLENECGLSSCQVVYLIKQVPRIINCRTETLKRNFKRAEELGIARSSQMIVHAIIVVSSCNERIIDARLSNLKSLGLSQDEIIDVVSKCPQVLKKPEELIGRKLEFLVKQMGLDKLVLINNPVLLTLSLEKRLMPRSLVLKLLVSKGFSGARGNFATYAKQNDKQFVEKIVLPYEMAIPGLHQAYTDACSGKSSAREWFKIKSQNDLLCNLGTEMLIFYFIIFTFK